jgi:hypothetical protein
MRILGIVLVLILSAIAGSAQDVWQSVPTVAPGPHDHDLVGATVDAIAKRGEKESRARVVVSVARKWGTAEIGVWIPELSEMISEQELRPYMGPDLGREAKNTHMIEIMLISQRGKVQFNSRMVTLAGGNFPNGVASDVDLLFATNCKTDKRIIAFLDQMDSGFDHGVVKIGRGVFSPPIEVDFGGNGIHDHFKAVMLFVGTSKAKASTARKQ